MNQYVIETRAIKSYLQLTSWNLKFMMIGWKKLSFIITMASKTLLQYPPYPHVSIDIQATQVKTRRIHPPSPHHPVFHLCWKSLWSFAPFNGSLHGLRICGFWRVRKVWQKSSSFETTQPATPNPSNFNVAFPEILAHLNGNFPEHQFFRGRRLLVFREGKLGTAFNLQQVSMKLLYTFIKR